MTTTQTILTTLDDEFTGTADNETIIGLGGNDYINGQKGDDIIKGGAGNDELDGGLGNDNAFGGEGDDTIFGRAGDDELKGESGDDYLNGGRGDDIVKAGEGNDEAVGGAGDDSIYGYTGDDILKGHSGDDYIEGGAGADTLKGGKGNDTLIADEDDVFVGGGKGFDTVTVNDSDGDGVVDVDFTDPNMRSIEAIIGDGQDRGDTVNATVNLNKIMFQSQDDGDAATPDTDNTFIAVGIDSLIIEANKRWLDDGEMSMTSTDLDSAAEAEYLQMVGITDSVDLFSYTFTKSTGQTVSIVTDLTIDEIFDSRDNESLADLVPDVV